MKYIKNPDSEVAQVVWLSPEYDISKVFRADGICHYIEDPCTRCRGSGKSTYTCPLCGGKKRVLLFFTCPGCKGEGKIVDNDKKCNHCKGEGKIHIKAKRFDTLRFPLIRMGQNI